MEFIDICAVDELPPGKSRAVRVAGKDIALFNVAGTVHAIANACLHQGSALADGIFSGRTVACRAHGWRYDVTTGALAVSPELGVACYPVEVADGRVAVAVNGK
ncbi:MAG TPA: Rieske 2Fe-2S domain-containing protein [Azonexus sp.]|nr:Rieske 2Fe-2S domain-containing protein [Azonexus sp.]